MQSIKKKIATLLLSVLTIVSTLGGSMAMMTTTANAQPSTISGRCYVKLIKILPHPAMFSVTMPDGKTYTGYCIDQGKHVRQDGEYPFTGTLAANGKYDIVVNTREGLKNGMCPWNQIHPKNQAITLEPGKPHTIQRVGNFQWVPQGKVKLLKSVADNKALTEECKKMYSLAGAEYTVYEDAALTRSQGKLITKEDGSTNELEQMPGTYYVKETKAPKGYALDQKVYTVTITAGETATIESKDSPLFDPVGIVLRKTSDGESYLNTDADMSGAEFTISYYDEMTDDVTGKTPTRVWKLKTIKHPKFNRYDARFRDKYKISGDEWYRTEKGEIVIPRGTVAIQETKAPKGFKVDPKVYITHVDNDLDSQANLVYNFGNTPEQPNKPLVPKIKTTAMSENTKNNVGEYGKKIKIIDKVSYKELSEGEKYTVKGKLMDKETNKPLKDKDGKEITAEKTFTVTKDNSTITDDGASGTVELTYEVDSILLKGKTTVIFEKLFYDDKEVATHEDINDEGQSIHFPGIKTTAKSKESGTNVGHPSKEETIIDVVKYDNLMPGKEYTVKGTLMDKDTKKPLKDKDGNEITAEKTFTPEKDKGSVELVFVYDSSIRQGKSTVVFEDLEYDKIKVAVHADIEDKDQTIVYPKIGTTLTGKDGTKTVIASKNTKLVDVIRYENLIPGKEYTIKGELMVKETGEPLKVNNEVVKAETKFKPTNKDGVTSITFTVDTANLEGKHLVAFETLISDKGDEIVDHKDINDNDQTVKVVNAPPKTGDVNKANMLLGSMFVLCLTGLTTIIIKKKKENN